jgi:hypothetical protein
MKADTGEVRAKHLFRRGNRRESGVHDGVGETIGFMLRLPLPRPRGRRDGRKQCV